MFASEDKSIVEKHVEREHAKRMKCQVCDEYFKGETMKEHTDSIHKIPEPFPCELCGLVMANYTLLQDQCQWANLSVGMEAFYLFRLVPSHYWVLISCTALRQGWLLGLGLGRCIMIM